MITAVTEAGTDVSFAEMQRLPARGRGRDPTRSGRDRRGVGHRRQPDQSRRPMPGRLAITLKPRDSAAMRVSTRSSRGSSSAVADVAGMTVYFQATCRTSRFPRARAARSTSTRWSAPTRDEVIDVGRQAGSRSLRGNPGAFAKSHPEAQEGGPRMQVRRRPRAGPAGSASRCRASPTRSTTPSASARFRRSTARPTSTASSSKRSRDISSDPNALVEALRDRSQHSTGTAATVANTATGTTNTNTTATPNAVTGATRCRCASFARFEHTIGAACHRAPGAVPGGHHQLQSRAPATRCSDAVAAISRGAAGDRHADAR